MATTTRSLTSFKAARALKGAKNDESKPDVWSSLLDSVASGKRLPEKRMVLLGASATTQRDFLEILQSKPPKTASNRQRQQPPIANDFALGYTYQEVLDTDQEDVLARLSIYTLQNSSPSFSTLLQPLITPATIPDTLLVILLDWSEPWNWLQQIRDWIRLVHTTTSTLGEDAKVTMQEVMEDWQQQRRGGAYDMGLSNAPPEANVVVPLSQGEWDEALGLPLCVVCHNVDQIDVLEREYGWREDDFDYILQFLRTILLKHGASLVYTSSSMPNSAALLIQYSLGIRSMLKREPLKHNVIDRDKILIPPNWDTWGKIKVLRDGFDIEGTSDSWNLESQPLPANSSENVNGNKSESSALLQTWAEFVKTPNVMTSVLPTKTNVDGLETETIDMQKFLASQTETIERLKAEEEETAAKETVKGDSDTNTDLRAIDETSRVKEHVGPIQFNMGGINLDAEDMLNHIKERSNARSTSPEKRVDIGATSTPSESSKQTQQDPEDLKNFFASLIKKSGGSTPGTPPRGSRK